MKMIINTIQWLLSTILHYVRKFYEYVKQLVMQRTGKVITFDTGKRVVIGQQLAEGGFSYIFLAYDVTSTSTTGTSHKRHSQARSKERLKYAVKRIHCPDSEIMNRCRYEADVHRTLMSVKSSLSETQVMAQYVMPLYGFAIIQNDCYMLFPLCTESLRDMVNRLNPFLQSHSIHSITTTTNNTSAPMSELMALQLFRQICYGVQALHICGYTHRDIKLENVLLLKQPLSVLPHLVLMDFGSSGPLEQMIVSRKDILQIVEQASQHTTMPYRPPELLDGEIRLNNNNNKTNMNYILDYCAVDVWSLGCTLHAILYGASPFECEFVIPSSSHYPTSIGSTCSTMKIVDCTHLSIIGNIPIPKYPPISLWYSDSIQNELILPMLQQDPLKRPKLISILQTIERMIEQLGGTIVDMPSIINDDDDDDNNNNVHYQYSDNEHDNGISLLSRVA
jgi:serine/threonine kinase 16